MKPLITKGRSSNRGVQRANLSPQAAQPSQSKVGVEFNRQPPAPHRLDGIPAIEMEGQRMPMAISNDDYAEIKRFSPSDYRFGTGQGAIVGSDRVRYTVYDDMFNYVPVKSPQALSSNPEQMRMLSRPIGQNQIISEIDSSPVMGVDARWTEANEDRDRKTMMARAISDYDARLEERDYIEGTKLKRKYRQLSPAEKYEVAARRDGMPADPYDVYPTTWTDSPDFGENASAPYRNGSGRNDGYETKAFPTHLMGQSQKGKAFVERANQPYRVMRQGVSTGAVARRDQPFISGRESPNAAARSIYVDGPQGTPMPPVDQRGIVQLINGVSPNESLMRRGNFAAGSDPALASQYSTPEPADYTTSSNPRVIPVRESDYLIPASNGSLVRKAVPNAFAMPVAPSGGYDIAAINPVNTYRIASPYLAKNEVIKGSPSVMLPSTNYADSGLSDYPLVGRRPDDLNQMAAGGNEGFDQYEYTPLGDDPDDVRVQAVNVGLEAQDQVNNLNRSARYADAGYRSSLDSNADYYGVYPKDLEREVVLRGMGPEDQFYARAYADQDQSAARLPANDLQALISQQQTMPGFGNGTATSLANRQKNDELVDAYLKASEMRSRAGRGQAILDNVQTRTLDLPDQGNYRVTFSEPGNDGWTAPRSVEYEGVDYRDILGKAQDAKTAGFGQMQQALPAQVNDAGQLRTFMQIGPESIAGYSRGTSPTSNYQQDLAAGTPFTSPNQIFVQASNREAGDPTRQFYGNQTLPVTISADGTDFRDYDPNNALQIQPIYTPTDAERRNTVGQRLRGEGYSPEAVLADVELRRRAQNIREQKFGNYGVFGERLV